MEAELLLLVRMAMHWPAQAERPPYGSAIADLMSEQRVHTGSWAEVCWVEHCREKPPAGRMLVEV